MKIIPFFILITLGFFSVMQGICQGRILEFRSYHLKDGTGKEFNRLFVEQALPMLNRWKIEVITFGPSLDDENSFLLVRAFSTMAERQRQEDAFYGSDEWKNGPREPILSMIENYITMVVAEENMMAHQTNDSYKRDMETLHSLNEKFIKNFINQDVIRHNEIIHPDFVCIENNGEIVDRTTYLKNWATDYQNGKFKTFSIADEVIRLFNNTALVRSTAHYTRIVNGKVVQGSSVYTDTYLRENGNWLCVQAQITPVVKN